MLITGQSISCITFMTQCHLKVNKSISKSNKQKYHFQQIKLGTCVIPLFHGFLSEKSFYGIILLIQDLIFKKQNRKKCNMSFWCDKMLSLRSKAQFEG